ncbi:MAG TPA: ribosome biogenesis/translation initiation ATPase RLI [archaeon]|nr:ribosome biogenesis/translation initiation ATPase RLI [archaeon]
MATIKRIAVVDNEELKDKETNLWIQSLCPVNRTGVECISVNPTTGLLSIDENTCIGCGICVKAAPNAISVINLPTELREDPIHRYGKNLFALYRLPIPKKGIIVGLVGPNGIGKSTVLNILSGNLRPNRGKDEKEGTKLVSKDQFQAEIWDETIQQFKGTELQAYLENIKNVKTGYKAQNIDLLPKIFSGKVRDILKKIDKNNIFDLVVSDFKIERLLGKNVSELSGGELQLIAIAGTILKGGDFYFFDEPSSYLDVEQRLLAAKNIRKLAEGGYSEKDAPYLIVVEHDLAISDYLADQVHMLYGNPGVFGVVSKPESIRVGINSYLEGYVKEDNVRFRQYPIIFSRVAKSPEKMKLVAEFGEFEKRFPNFTLKTSAGSLGEGEIIGILGPNGIGKTTFVNMLAGILKPDKGELLNLRLSYKPQRLFLEEKQKDMLVRDFIGNLSTIQNTIHLLKVERLLDRLLGRLSGGELQAVFICRALAQDHEILLLDEPSAFLDVEQRLALAKVLDEWTKNRGVSGFVVDHDLQVIDAVSNRLIVFDGQPAVSGFANSPEDLKNGMNRFLKKMDVTFRRDKTTHRPRVNKPGSVLDREQKEKGKYYYD